MIYSSIAELPFFDSFRDEDIVSELDIENNFNEEIPTNNNNSILDSARGAIALNESHIALKKNICKC